MTDGRGHGEGPRTRTAAEVFDAVGARYEEAFADVPGQLAALDWIIAELPRGARVLDVGSGTGRPAAHLLDRAGLEVTGIDVSPEMVRLARARVPAAHFEQVDVREHRAPEGGYDAVCSFFPLLVMDQPEIRDVLTRMAGWLVPGGLLALATVPGDIRGLEIDWMGHPVTVSSLSAEQHVTALEAAGLEVVGLDTAVFRPHGPDAVPEEHLYLRARRPGR
ncbi:class I SAM-dependent methyltransferase (plasmid) [Streptomyces sp. BI20]|uniref:class I SAM-dependent methyltransferase n=1 Tax=Streptomyces sp. BI20 TaxID=3403460 RepID=UPI003C72E134